MSNNAQLVTTGKPKIGGAIFVGPTTVELPTTAAEALVGFTGLGYCSDEGVKNANEISSEDIKAWGGDVVNSSENGFKDKFTVKLIEALNANVLKEVHGSENVTGTLESGIKVAVGAYSHKRRAWVVDMIMTDDVLKRIVIPNGKITAVSEITYSDTTAVGYEVTISAYPDASGHSHYEYIENKAEDDENTEG